LGKTSLKGHVNIRHQCEIAPRLKEDLTIELREKLVEASAYIDVITFGYNGEPTLNRNLHIYHDLARKLRFEAGIKKVPVTTLTNSSTLGDPTVRKVLSTFDIVVAKLDAGSQEIFHPISKPHVSVPPLKEIIKNIKLLKSEMKAGSNLYIQTLLFKVRTPSSLTSNATEENIALIAKAVNDIVPDQVQIYTVKRPPAEPQVKAITHPELIKLSDFMANLVNSPIEVYHFH